MKKIVLALLSLSLLSPLAMATGNKANAVSFSPEFGYQQFDSRFHIKNKFLPNFMLAYEFNDNWGIEAGASAFSTRQTVAPKKGVHGNSYTLNGVYHFNTDSSFQPMLFAGPGVIHLNPNENDPNDMVNLNAGAGLQYFINRWLALRTDVREAYTFSGGKFSFAAMVGLTLQIGGGPDKAAAPAAQDTQTPPPAAEKTTYQQMQGGFPQVAMEPGPVIPQDSQQLA